MSSGTTNDVLLHVHDKLSYYRFPSKQAMARYDKISKYTKKSNCFTSLILNVYTGEAWITESKPPPICSSFN
jgi:hypothetical protein